MNKKNFEGIIVLSNLMNSKGVLNNESTIRADKAGEIFKTNKLSKVITCGWNYREDSEIKIADAMANYLHTKHGIPLENLLRVEQSKDTVGDAIFTRKNIIPQYKLRNLLVITSNYHIKRTKEIFNFVYGNDYKLNFFGCNVPFNNDILNAETKSLMKFKNTFKGINRGNIYEIFDCLLKKHPYYKVDI